MALDHRSTYTEVSQFQYDEMFQRHLNHADIRALQIEGTRQMAVQVLLAAKIMLGVQLTEGVFRYCDAARTRYVRDSLQHLASCINEPELYELIKPDVFASIRSFLELISRARGISTEAIMRQASQPIVITEVEKGFLRRIFG